MMVWPVHQSFMPLVTSFLHIISGRGIINEGNYTMEIPLTVVQIECATCHIPFWINEKTDGRFRSNHTEFFCPKGHVCLYSQKTKEEILMETVRARESRIQELSRELSAAKRRKKSKT